MPLTGREKEGRVLALDVGGKRIGVAVSDETGTLATPIGYVTRDRQDVAELRRLIGQYGISRLVAGLPTGLSGREGPQALDVREYAERVAAEIGLPLDYWDERLTTTIAERALIAAGTRRAQRRERRDAVAAAIILQDYLDAARHRRRRGERGQGNHG